jgi:molybdenum ABC transporter ATP-binding protein
MLSVSIKKKLGSAAAAVGSQDASDTAGPGEFTLDVQFDAPPDVTILFGASGSGKTTTLKCIAGLLRPDAGHIAINDDALFDYERGVDLPIRKRGVGYVFQNLALFPHLSVRDNVEFGMQGLGKRERRARSAEMMEALHIGHTAARKPRDISGGEAQRVALARALGCRPRILLLDEPLSAIDEATKLGIIRDLKSINRRLQLPILYVTHSREEAVSVGSRVIVYDRGQVVARGEPLEVFGAPATASVARLTGVENIFEGRVIARNERGGTLTVEVTESGRGCRVEIPFINLSLDERVRVAIRSGDILLATEEPRSTSARNILEGRIEAIEQQANRTEVKVASGVSWKVSVTRQAADDLGLEAGQRVWLAFKTHSCLLLDE